MYYNFCRAHSTFRVTPAMESGLADHVWMIKELCELLPQPIPSTREAGRNMVIAALDRGIAKSATFDLTVHLHMVYAVRNDATDGRS